MARNTPPPAMSTIMSMLHCLNACYSPTCHQTWPSCGQGLACKLRFEVICKQLRVKCQTMTSAVFCFFSFLDFHLSHPHFNKPLLLSATVVTFPFTPFSFMNYRDTLPRRRTEMGDKAPRAVTANSGHVAAVNHSCVLREHPSAPPGCVWLQSVGQDEQCAAIEGALD